MSKMNSEFNHLAAKLSGTSKSTNGFWRLFISKLKFFAASHNVLKGRLKGVRSKTKKNVDASDARVVF